MRFALVLALGACGSHRDPPAGDPPAAPGPPPAYDEIVLDTPPGVSDLTIDDRGTLWAIPERDRFLVEIELVNGHVRTTKRLAIAGVPDDVDTEALTWLGTDTFAIGTEGTRTATAGILWASLRGDQLVVERQRPLSSAEVGVELKINHGVEGLCGHGTELLAAIETAGTFADGTRWAPLVRLHGDALSVSKLRLTSKTGKISALACTFAADGTADVYAIERHYEVSRMLHFTAAPGATDITPAIERDLDSVFHGRFNLEGLARLPDGRWALVNDNQGRDVGGPTELLVLHPR